jgi:hypothetical protein
MGEANASASSSAPSQQVAEYRPLPVLDAAQLIRIEAVHRGFLFQHLYAVAILLTSRGEAGASLIVERDEDVEIERSADRTYIQVKTRNDVLRRSDIADSLTRFGELRDVHANGERPGAPKFVIVSNADLGPQLAAEYAAEDWPSDVSFVTPNRPPADQLPAMTPTIAGMFEACNELALNVPFGSLSPDTLVLKLAALVQHASTGARDHRFQLDDLEGLFEQLVVQLRDFPEPPAHYRPQRNEPALVTANRVRLIVGFSGAGKTAWASESARHVADPVLYFDVGDLPTRSIAATLAREIVARFMGGRERGVGGVQIPPGSGMEILRWSDGLLERQGTHATIVIDNIHRLAAEDLRQIVEGAPHQSFVLLARPWRELALFEATLGIASESLQGFDEDGIASVFGAEDIGIEVETARSIIRLTGGLPLFAINAARLTAANYGGDAMGFCRAIEARTQDQDTAQDLILEAAFETLSPNARNVASLLGLCDVPLLPDEVRVLLSVLGADATWSAAVRELRRASMIVAYPRGGIGLHDAVRPLSAGNLAALEQASIDQALQGLYEALVVSLRHERDIPRLTFLIRLLPRVGRTDVLVDLATSEMFYEQGNMAMMWDTLVIAGEDESYSPLDRFWALDALAYWESRDGGIPKAERVEQMAALAEQHQFAAREQLNLIFKQLILASLAEDRREIERLAARGRKFATTPMMSRLLRYNRAIALYRIGALEAARRALEPLIDDYCAAMGFKESQLLGTNGPKLKALLETVPDREDIKRLADALNLWAWTVGKQGHPPCLRRIQAMKLYESMGAGRSAVVAGQDAADEMLHFNADPVGARMIMEPHVLALIREYHLTDLELKARAQYAVILAYCGDFEGAEHEVYAIANYGGDDHRVAEFLNQVMLIEEIRSGAVRLARQRPPPGGLRLALHPNEVGRRQRPDALCACGSGRKYKRCHGKR